VNYIQRIEPIDLLFALHFMRVYPTEEAGANFCKLDANTYRGKVRNALEVLDQSLPGVSAKSNPLLVPLGVSCDEPD
jgi:hypothetical protein